MSKTYLKVSDKEILRGFTMPTSLDYLREEFALKSDVRNDTDRRVMTIDRLKASLR